MRWAVLLAGGSGTRFWPLSTPENPKQLLPLTGSASSAEETVERLAGLITRDRTLVVAGAGLASRLQQRLQLPPENVLVEPRAASTAPALIWATWEARRRDPDAEVLSLHADWAVGDAAAFRRTADTALATARRHDRLVTVGVVPSRPETGYGYIVPGAPLDDQARTVARFSEKPDAATALDLMAAGALWNSGLFAWTAARLLAEVETHTPEVARALRHAYGATPSAAANDGIVPTRSQAWGRVIHAAVADHLDVLGHFRDASHDPPHVDWLVTGSGFNRARFIAKGNGPNKPVASNATLDGRAKNRRTDILVIPK
jgi:mannose-1-phosphate guanylyltransferase